MDFGVKRSVFEFCPHQLLVTFSQHQCRLKYCVLCPDPTVAHGSKHYYSLVLHVLFGGHAFAL